MSGSAPDRGDVVWLTFDPQAGHEQAGRRPAVVISPRRYNQRVGLALFCPITSQRKGYPFEVAIPEGLEVQGVVLSDQIRSLDWRARRASHAARLPPSTMSELTAKIWALVGEQE